MCTLLIVCMDIRHDVTLVLQVIERSLTEKLLSMIQRFDTPNLVSSSGADRYEDIGTKFIYTLKHR